MPRPDMPEGLYISVSQVKCFLRCPRQYELKYIRGEPPAFVPVPLAFGAAFHEALAAFYGEFKATRNLLRRDLVLDVFRDAWAKAVDGPVPLQGVGEEEGEDVGLSIDQIIDKGVSMLHAWYEHASREMAGVVVEEVEKGFAIRITDPETGEVLDEMLVGTIDLIAFTEDQRIVVEHKTAAKKYTQEQLRHDHQLTAYQIAARQMGLGEVGLAFQVVTKTKLPAIQVAHVRRDEQDEDDFLRTVLGVLRAVDAGVSFPIRSWACRSCQYQSPCNPKGGGA